MLHLLFDFVGSVVVDGFFHGIAALSRRKNETGQTEFSPLALFLVIAVLAIFGLLGTLAFLLATGQG